MRQQSIILLLLLMAGGSSAQFVCFSDSSAIYTFKGNILPPMQGEAVFQSGHFRVIVGGKFQDTLAPAEEAIYNCDVLVIDDEARLTYVLPLSYFPPFVDEQFAGSDYCYTADNDTAYIMGGFGYSLADGHETTFPTMTIFPIKTLIDSVVQQKDYLNLFEVIEADQRLAVKEGKMVHIGDYFLVYGGKQLFPILDDFTDCLTMNEWDFTGQLRKFRITRSEGFPELSEYQICNTSETFYQCMPEQWRPAPKQTIEQH